jgi:hypothetical protein
VMLSVAGWQTAQKHRQEKSMEKKGRDTCCGQHLRAPLQV